MINDPLTALVLVKTLRYSLDANCLGYIRRKNSSVSFNVNSIVELHL